MIVIEKIEKNIGNGSGLNPSFWNSEVEQFQFFSCFIIVFSFCRWMGCTEKLECQQFRRSKCSEEIACQIPCRAILFYQGRPRWCQRRVKYHQGTWRTLILYNWSYALDLPIKSLFAVDTLFRSKTADQR